MRYKLTLIVAGAAMLLLAVSAPTLLALVKSSPDPLTTPSPFSWSLQLRGARQANLTKGAFEKLEKKFAVTLIVNEKGTDVTYKGISLKKLVSLIDDKDPKTFNKALAAEGYGVEVTGIDFYSYVYSSTDVAAWGKNVIVANRAGGRPLTWGKINSSNEFSPIWPLKVVSDGTNVVLTGKQRPSAVMRIKIVAAPSPEPSPSAAAPF